MYCALWVIVVHTVGNWRENTKYIWFLCVLCQQQEVFALCYWAHIVIIIIIRISKSTTIITKSIKTCHQHHPEHQSSSSSSPSIQHQHQEQQEHQKIKNDNQVTSTGIMIESYIFKHILAHLWYLVWTVDVYNIYYIIVDIINIHTKCIQYFSMICFKHIVRPALVWMFT